jgi:AraC-like DNA-binding protein
MKSSPSPPSWISLLGQLRLEFESAVYYHCDADWQIVPRVKPEEHLHLVHAGQLEYTIGGRIYRAYRGNLVFCPPHVTWSTRRVSSTLAQLNVIHLQARFPGNQRYLAALGFPIVLRPTGKIQQTLFRLGREMARIYRERAETYLLRANGLLYEFFHAFYPLHGEMTAIDSNGEKILRVIHHLREHYREPIRLEDLSRLAGLSANHLGTLFRRQTGKGPIDYLIQIRLEEARRLLGLRGHRVKEVAAAVGYQDPAYFSRLFRKYAGVSPALCRRRGPSLI